jgi:DNA invertase Pin-like site-specific DNA recombinase
MVVAIVNRAHRRLAGAAATEVDSQQSKAARYQILELNAQHVSKREIARVLGISRVAVRKVLRANSATVPEIQRPEKAEPYRQQILELFGAC